MRVSKQNAGSSDAFSRQLWIMTVVTGTVVANIYYNQPLLNVIAASFHVPRAATGLVATVTQLGYASGLFFFVPWGDYVNRRRLILWLLGLSAAALAVAGLVPRLAWLDVASYAVGLTSVVPQILVPWAADLAPAGQRGRVVGLIMSGLLIGVLLARTVSGLLAAVVGWRGVFFAACCFMLVLSGAVRRGLPQTSPTHPLPAYRDLLASLVRLVRNEPELGRIALTGGTIFGAFSAFWTTLTFRLGLPPYNFPVHVIGLFGLAGVAGAVVAPMAGRLADRYDPRWTVWVSLGGQSLLFGLLVMLNSRLWAILMAVVLLDLFTNAAQISNQARMYALYPEARSRANTVYMVVYFLGGAAGSGLATLGWRHFGYVGVSLSALTLIALGAITHIVSFLRFRPYAKIPR
ncbi:MAG: MFS transporter [Sulfobacillus sp.]|nr:MFS transporter [Sulfobacillus sp.]